VFYFGLDKVELGFEVIEGVVDLTSPHTQPQK
jgi:hypothetical protein